MHTDDSPRFSVRIDPAGTHFDASAGETLLAAAAQAGIRLPSSCRNGTCRTCLCQLTRGEISYRIDWPGLSAEEKLEGSILPCVAEARSDLVIEAPRAMRL